MEFNILKESWKANKMCEKVAKENLKKIVLIFFKIFLRTRRRRCSRSYTMPWPQTTGWTG